MAVLLRPFRADTRPAAPPSPGSAATGSAFEIIEIKPPNAASFYLRLRLSGVVFLVAPARCPGQPRFWSLWIHRCLPGGMVDPTEPPWVIPERLRREDLAAAAKTIRDDVDGWLKRNGQATLRCWMLGAARGA